MDRLAFVTGAAGDLGRATGLALAADGWSLLLTDHPSREEDLEETGAMCRAEGADVALSWVDVTCRTDLARSLEQTSARFGAPAAVAANAGVQGDFAPVHEADPERAARVLEVNVIGVLNTIAVAAQAMIRSGTAGSIVAMASMAGVSGAPNMPAYSASKAAVVGLVKSAAKDLAPHDIRVNAVSPAFIGPGAMWDNQVSQQAAVGSQYFDSDPQEVARQMIAMVPMRRHGTPAEVADAVCYLVGQRSTYLTGVNLEVSGGSV